MDYIPLFLMAPLLVAVAYFDLRFMRIPNMISLIAVALFLATLPFFPPSHLAVRLGAAALVFGLGFTAFAFGMIGAGDVKILSVLMLFVPPVHMTIFANVFSASMLAGIVVILSLRRIPVTSTWGWKSFGGTTKLPMGLSIAMTGLAFPLVALALQH
jgi:prepilin peptidase CpaA